MRTFPGPAALGCTFSFSAPRAAELCFFGGDEKHGNRSISRRGTSLFFKRQALSEICHLLCGGEDDLRQSRSSSSVGGQVVQLTSSICINKIARSTLRD